MVGRRPGACVQRGRRPGHDDDDGGHNDGDDDDDDGDDGDVDINRKPGWHIVPIWPSKSRPAIAKVLWRRGEALVRYL